MLKCTKMNFQVRVGQKKCMHMCMKCCTMLVGAQHIDVCFGTRRKHVEACGYLLQ